MADYVLLKKEEHRALRIRTNYEKGLSDAVGIVEVVPQEFRSIAANYPILLTKDEVTDRYLACALLGLEQDENLFLTDSKWDATYIPLHVQRGPFHIGFQVAESGAKEMMVSVDMSSALVNEADGEQLFTENGEPSTYLEHINTILAKLVAGTEAAKVFIELIAKHGLIKPMDFSVVFEDGKKGEIHGLHTIDDEKLRNLTGEALRELNENGVLMLAHIQIASLAQIDRLIDKKAQLIQ